MHQESCFGRHEINLFRRASLEARFLRLPSVLTMVDDDVADLESVERDASSAIAGIRSGERLVIPTDALNL